MLEWITEEIGDPWRRHKVNKFLDAQKALEAIVFVSHKTNDLFHIVKILFYADKFHLEEYGRQISGDIYCAMEDGPVPSGAYDLIKIARGDKYHFDQRLINVHPEESIKVINETNITPLRGPNFDYLSESDIDCLNKAITNFAPMDGRRLWALVHDEPSYTKVERNKFMHLQDIILSLPNGKDILAYLND